MKIISNIQKRYYLVYLRKSSESEERQVQSIEDQKKEIKPIIENRSLEILEAFEESKSAKAPGRTEFDRMAKLISEREDIKGIVCWKLNRLSRNPVDTGALQWLLQSKKIEEIVTPSKTYTEIDSDFIMAVEGAQANRFIRDLKEDTWRGMKSKIEKGMAPVLAVPGYLNDKTKDQGKKDIIVNPVQFPLMRKLFDMALTGNYSITDLYEYADKMGIRTNRGKKISHSRMAELLKDIFYVGKFVYGGQTYDGIHKPMLTIPEFELLQEIFSKGDRPRPSIHNNPYSGDLVRCVCGRSLSLDPKIKTYKNGKSQEFVYLRCNRPHYQPNSVCPRSSINIKDLENQIHEQLGTIRISPDLIKWGIGRLNEKNLDKQKAREAENLTIKQAYDRVVAQLDNLLQLKLSPNNVNGSLLSDLEYAEKRVILLKERDKYNVQHESLDKNREDWAQMAVAVFNFAARAQERFATGDLETKRDICKIFGTSLILNNKKLEVLPRTPFVLIKDALTVTEPNKMPMYSSEMAIHASEDNFGVVYGS